MAVTGVEFEEMQRGVESAEEAERLQMQQFSDMFASLQPYQPTADDTRFRRLSERGLGFGDIEAAWGSDVGTFGESAEDRFYQYDPTYDYWSADPDRATQGRWLPKNRQELIDAYQSGDLEGQDIMTSTGSLTQGLSDYNQAYGAYLTAGEQATQAVNTEISSEMSNAALLGIDYNMTDELKKDRINNAFAGIWSEQDQAGLEGLQASYGDFDTYDTGLFTRGDATSAGRADTGPNVKSTSQQFATGTPDLLQEEEQLGGVSNILGV